MLFSDQISSNARWVVNGTGAREILESLLSTGTTALQLWRKDEQIPNALPKRATPPLGSTKTQKSVNQNVYVLEFLRLKSFTKEIHTFRYSADLMRKLLIHKSKLILEFSL